MRRLGQVLHLSSSHNLLVKVEALPRIGAKVVDENLKKVGTVHDVLGPVSAPYAAIKVEVQHPEQLVGKTLYMDPSRQRRKERRKFGR